MRILTDCIDSVREQDKTHHKLYSEINPSTLLNIPERVNLALFTGQHKAGNISSGGKSVSLKFLEHTSLASIQGSTLVSYMLMNNSCFDTHHDNWDWPLLIHAFIYLEAACCRSGNIMLHFSVPHDYIIDTQDLLGRSKPLGGHLLPTSWTVEVLEEDVCILGKACVIYEPPSFGFDT